MLPLVVPNMCENVIQVLKFKPFSAEWPKVTRFLDSAVQVEKKGVVVFIVFSGNLGDWQGLQHLLVFSQKLIIPVQRNHILRGVCSGSVNSLLARTC